MAYLTCRYMAAPEGVLRLHNYPICDMFPSVYFLPIHEENCQTVMMTEEEYSNFTSSTLPTASNKATKLTAFFLLCQHDLHAREYIYTEIPLYYTY
jgi:hypothetical protein